jgi:PleD family two-component response regulator
MHLRVLVAESDPEDLLFLEDVLTEIEEGRHWSPWAEVESLGASTCMEVAAILPREPVDVILLNPNLSDMHGAAAFRRVQALAPQIPIILLIEAEDRDLAAQMVREGAQDFVIKKQIDCAPLAHAIRNAMERQRLLMATRSTTMTDPLTGLLHRGAFFSLAERDRKVAERLGRRLLLMVAEPRNLSELAAAMGEHRRDLALVEASDVLRSLAGYTGLLARIGPTRFALALFPTSAEPVESAWARIHSAAEGHRIAMGAAIFEPDQPTTLEVLLERAELDLAESDLAPPALTPQDLAAKAASVRP